VEAAEEKKILKEIPRIKIRQLTKFGAKKNFLKRSDEDSSRILSVVKLGHVSRR
jgi:hypothetical protein